MSEDKTAAYLTLHEMLVGTARLLAPFTPFVAEEIYRNLEVGARNGAPESVHLSDYPECREELIDLALERSMELARKVVTLGRAARNRVSIKIRQPLAEMIVAPASPEDGEAIVALESLIREELNVKTLRLAANAGEFVAHRVKPRYGLLGPKYGRRVKEIVAGLAELDPEEVVTTLERQGSVEVPAEGGAATVLGDELVVETTEREGYAVESGGGLACALATTLTRDLVLEGLAREMVNKIQVMRKEADLDIEDRISTVYWSDEEVREACGAHRGYVMEETLCEDLTYGGAPEDAKPQGEVLREWDVNGHMVVVSVSRKGGSLRRTVPAPDGLPSGR